MAIVLFTRIPELSLDRYDRMMSGLGLDASPPPGMILHIATEAAGSVNVCEVWQTPETAESFVAQRLRPALGEQRVKEPLSYRIEPLHNLFAPDMDMIGRIGGHSLPPGLGQSALAS